MLQRDAFATEVPRGISTKQMARPSGVLWMAIAVVMETPSSRYPERHTDAHAFSEGMRGHDTKMEQRFTCAMADVHAQQLTSPKRLDVGDDIADFGQVQ
jgi:hypothetical protein